MKHPKFWIYIIATIVAAMIGLCLVSCQQQKRPDNGHDYDLELMQPTPSKHSVDCRKCKAIREAEIKHYVDSALKAKGL